MRPLGTSRQTFIQQVKSERTGNTINFLPYTFHQNILSARSYNKFQTIKTIDGVSFKINKLYYIQIHIIDKIIY